MVGEGEQVLLELGQRHGGPHRHAVAEQVQVARLEVDDPLAGRVGHPGVADVPLARHRPVQHLGAGGDLVDLQAAELAADDLQGAAHAVAGDAAADRVELGDQLVQLLAGGHGPTSG
jgi:hypothetical protein